MVASLTHKHSTRSWVFETFTNSLPHRAAVCKKKKKKKKKCKYQQENITLTFFFFLSTEPAKLLSGTLCFFENVMEMHLDVFHTQHQNHHTLGSKILG